MDSYQKPQSDPKIYKKILSGKAKRIKHFNVCLYIYKTLLSDHNP